MMTAGSTDPAGPRNRAPRPPAGRERETLQAFLRSHRETFAAICAGLTPQDLARRSAGRSALSLLGLIRHCAQGEQFWFRQVMAGQQPDPLFGGDDAFAVDGADEQLVAQAWEVWRAEVSFAENFVDGAENLDITGVEPGEGPVSLRFVVLHVIEEYARHNGHADLLRENIDGAVNC